MKSVIKHSHTNVKKPITIILSFILFFMVGFSVIVKAQDNLPSAPTSEIYFQDYANMFSNETKQTILREAKALDDKTTAQISIVTVNSLDGKTPQEYGTALFKKWGIGNKQKNNGILFLISKNDRKTRIDVGYGLEGRINDAKAGDILREVEKYFKSSKYDEGVLYAFQELANNVYTEYDIQSPYSYNGLVKDSPNTSVADNHKDDGLIVFFVVLFFGVILLIIIIALIISSKNNRGSGGGGYYGGYSGYSGSSDSSSSSWDSSSSSDSGSFGGGDCGGGGADGGW